MVHIVLFSSKRLFTYVTFEWGVSGVPESKIKHTLENTERRFQF